MPVWPKFLATLALLAVMALAAAGFMALWPYALIESALVPRVPFAAPTPLPAVAYEGNALWFARPGIAGKSNPVAMAPRGWRDPPAVPTRTPVFFVPGTTSFASHHWNDRLDRRDSVERDRQFLALMASAFNRSEVWAPIYREAVSGAFLGPPRESRAAIDAAYADVLTAFDAFVATLGPDRPFVLAGHGQGALMVLRLLRDRVLRGPLASRLAAAYAIGWPVPRFGLEERLGLAPCIAPDQPACLLSWNSFAEPADPEALRAMLSRLALYRDGPNGPPFVCTNPLTGGAAPTAAASSNLGTLIPDPSGGGGVVRPALVPARCNAQGWLLIGRPVALGSFVQPGNNYTTYDIPLFWANLRADVARREAGWYARHHD